MKKTKSSSGDTSWINPYMKGFVGQEVTTWIIDRTTIPYSTREIKKIL